MMTSAAEQSLRAHRRCPLRHRGLLIPGWILRPIVFALEQRSVPIKILIPSATGFSQQIIMQIHSDPFKLTKTLYDVKEQFERIHSIH